MKNKQTREGNEVASKVEQILCGNTDVLLDEARSLGQRLAANDLSKSQIRNIYSTVKRIYSTGRFEEEDRHLLKLLIPKLEYAIAREQRSQNALRHLGDMLTQCILRVENSVQFNHFAEFFEAIVAYHYSAVKHKEQERKHFKGGR